MQPTYYKHLGFYAYRKGFLLTFVALPEGEWERFEKLEQLRALEYGYRVRVVLGSDGSHAPHCPPSRGTPPDEPQPKMVNFKLAISQAPCTWLLW